MPPPPAPGKPPGPVPGKLPPPSPPLPSLPPPPPSPPSPSPPPPSPSPPLPSLPPPLPPSPSECALEVAALIARNAYLVEEIRRLGGNASVYPGVDASQPPLPASSASPASPPLPGSPPLSAIPARGVLVINGGKPKVESLGCLMPGVHDSTTSWPGTKYSTIAAQCCTSGTHKCRRSDTRVVGNDKCIAGTSKQGQIKALTFAQAQQMRCAWAHIMPEVVRWRRLQLQQPPGLYWFAMWQRLGLSQQIYIKATPTGSKRAKPLSPAVSTAATAAGLTTSIGHPCGGRACDQWRKAKSQKPWVPHAWCPRQHDLLAWRYIQHNCRAVLYLC